MRYSKIRRSALIILTFILVVGAVFSVQKAIYTSSLSTRAFSLGLSEAVEKLEPANIQNHSQRLVASAIYEGLVYYDEERQSIQPRLAKSWKYSPDGRSISLQLRKNVKFSNGKQLTAQDVKASFEYNIANSKDWNNTCLYLPIAGGKEKINGKTTGINGIEVLDRHNLKITLTKPHAAFIASLSNPIFWIMDLESGLTPPAGTGAYMLQTQSAQSLQLLPNAYYHRGRPHLSALNVIIYSDDDAAFKAYKEGKLDFLDNIPSAEAANIRSSKEYKGLLIDKPVLETYCLGFNMHRAPYANSYLLRRALNYAIDREQIIKQLPVGAYLPINGPVPAGLEVSDEVIPGYNFDAAKARQLLVQAGYPEGKGLPILTLTYNDDPGHAIVAGEVARQLAGFGIRVQTQQQGWDYFKNQINSRALSFFRLSWAADYYDADNFLYSLYHSSQIGMTNYCGYQNPQVDKHLENSRQQSRDLQTRKQLLHRAEAIIIDDAPCLWLFQKKAQKIIGKDVRNLKLDSMEMVDWYQVELIKPTTE